jgi:hypothetical protein
LVNKREELCFKLIESESPELEKLEMELSWVEELLNEEWEKLNEKEN